MQSAPPPAKTGTSPAVIILIVVVVVLLLIVAIVGVLAALGIFGARRYISLAKQAEGRNEVMHLAHGIASCGTTNAAAGQTDPLPSSSRPVPALLADVSGKKYMSNPSEWKDPAFACAKFELFQPQYFQYEWVKSGAITGKARALGDFDGDGTAEAVFEVPITCAGGSCAAGVMSEKVAP